MLLLCASFQGVISHLHYRYANTQKKAVLADLDASVMYQTTQTQYACYAQTMLHQHTPVLRCHIVSVIFFSRSRIVMLQNERI